MPLTIRKEGGGVNMNYDIIGDIHGQSGKLRSLLARLGYRQKDGAYRHLDRQALFVGDFSTGSLASSTA